MKGVETKRDADNARRLLRSILKDRLWRQPTWLARRAGVAASTITGFLGNPDKVPPTPPRAAKLRAETVLRIDQVLAAEQVDERLRRDFQTAALGIEISGQPAPGLSPAAGSGKPESPASGAPAPLSDESLTYEALLARAHRLGTQPGRRLEAEQAALQAGRLCEEGTTEWAEAVLFRALMRQQMGDISEARTSIAVVEEAVEQARLEGATPQPRIAGLIFHYRGWLHLEQLGEPRTARDLFVQSQKHARNAGEADLLLGNLHFQLRSTSVGLLAGTGTLLAARPRRDTPLGFVKDVAFLEQALESAAWKDMASYGNSHLDLLEFDIRAFLGHENALTRLQRHQERFTTTGRGHLLALGLARWLLAEQNWAEARTAAEQAFYGYAGARYPPGMALSAAIDAYARGQERFVSEVEARQCLDRWVLALLLHPYETHPLRWLAVRQLRALVQLLERTNPRWLRGYRAEWESRLARRDQFFAWADSVDDGGVLGSTDSIRWLLG